MVASGVKVLVLAVIVGIGSTLFSQFVTTYGGAQPTLEDVLALALASLCLMGLGIFGPGIATGLVSGAPQLGAGAAVGTAMTAGGLAVAGGMAASAGVSAIAGLGRAGASVAGGAMAATRGGSPSGGSPSGGPSPGPAPASPSGPSGSPDGGSGAAAQPSMRPAKSSDGGDGGSSGSEGGASGAPAEPVPEWAKRMRQGQAIRGIETAAHAVGSGHGGGSTSLDLSEGSE